MIAALGAPHDLIADALRRLGRHDGTAVTTFTDDDKMLRGREVAESNRSSSSPATPKCDPSHPSPAIPRP